jgi:hypothetical protein
MNPIRMTSSRRIKTGKTNQRTIISRSSNRRPASRPGAFLDCYNSPPYLHSVRRKEGNVMEAEKVSGGYVVRDADGQARPPD